jgi:hypothetical protein
MRSSRIIGAALASALTVPAQAQAQTPAYRRVAENVAMATSAIDKLRDSVSLRGAGYIVIGFGAMVKDLTPFQGQHWISLPRFTMNAEVDPNFPTFMMYLPLGDSLMPVGVAYSKRVPANAQLPDDLAGEKVQWHAHAMCRNVPGEGQALSDGPEDCAARGGVSAPFQIAMVHTWTIANPDGAYAHDNPALPYVATGLKPPTTATRDDRLLGLALGETYGAKLPIAHRIEFEARRRGTAQALDAPREKLRALLTQLRDAERTGNEAKMKTIRKNMTDAYKDVANAYKSIARTPEIAARLDVEMRKATGEIAHHHM